MRLKEDSSSWKSNGIKRRDFRHDPGTPDTEVPRKQHAKGKNKKHVHKYRSVVIGRVLSKPWWNRHGEPRWTDKVQYICDGCGNRRSTLYWPYH